LAMNQYYAEKGSFWTLSLKHKLNGHQQDSWLNKKDSKPSRLQ
jgi:hypothetical protein